MNDSLINNAIGLVIIFIGIMLAILSFWALWLVFAEAKKPGWAVFIPGYGQYVMAKIAKKSSGITWAYTLFGIVTFMIQIYQYSNESQLANTIDIVSAFLFFAFSIYIVIGMAKQYSGVTKAFWVAYVILPFLCLFELRKLEYKQ